MLNFHGWSQPWNYFSSEIFTIYGTSIWVHHTTTLTAGPFISWLRVKHPEMRSALNNTLFRKWTWSHLCILSPPMQWIATLNNTAQGKVAEVRGNCGGRVVAHEYLGHGSCSVLLYMAKLQLHNVWEAGGRLLLFVNHTVASKLVHG